jgi:hypothetical protein
MKRTDDIADLTLYAALFSDIAAWDTDLHKPLVGDYRRLEAIVSTRGVSFIMIDMPDAGKKLDSALSSGHLDFSLLPNTFGRREEGAFRPFLACLFSKVFDSDGRLIPCDETAIFFLRSVLYLAKKVDMPCSSDAIAAEVAAFKEIEDALPNPTLDWNSNNVSDFDSSRVAVSFLDPVAGAPADGSVRPVCPRPLLKILDEVTSRLSSRFGSFDWRAITPKHGPGAVADAKTGSDKYLFPTWPVKLESVFPYTYFAQHREDLHLECDHLPSPIELPARLLAVPKTLKGPRMIASEPTSHQFIQLGLMEWMREHLPRSLGLCINFKDQTVSQRFCLDASKSGVFGTVDLSAASDRLTCWVVERVFKSNPAFLDALFASRTRTLTNACSAGEMFTLTLKKFAPMGSGVTFPVQTVCYAMFCIAVLLYERGLKPTEAMINLCARDIRVFGDDIIMPSSAVPTLANLLTYLWLKVNASKTHYRGRFRESCGVDGFNGVDVTPLYLSSLSLRSAAIDLESWVDVSNNAYSKGLWCLSDTMVKLIPSAVRARLPVSHKALGCLTLRTYQPTTLNGKVRISKHLHRPEVLGLSFEVKLDKRRRESHASLLQYFLEKPRPDTNWESGYVVTSRSRLRKRWVPWY